MMDLTSPEALDGGPVHDRISASHSTVGSPAALASWGGATRIDSSRIASVRAVEPSTPTRSVLRDLGLAPSPRLLTDAERARFELNLAEILAALGLDLDTPATRDTPRRLLSALVDATDGYEGDPKLVTAFASECRAGADCELAQIVEGPISFASLCEHHALPFVGEAWLGYVAHEEILGISKLTRLVRVVTRRFSVQERLAHSLADSLAALTDAHGVAIYLEADHMCIRTRGVRDHGSRTRTTAYRGVYERDASLRAEFREIAGIGRGDR